MVHFSWPLIPLVRINKAVCPSNESRSSRIYLFDGRNAAFCERGESIIKVLVRRKIRGILLGTFSINIIVNVATRYLYLFHLSRDRKVDPIVFAKFSSHQAGLFIDHSIRYLSFTLNNSKDPRYL